VVEDVYGAVDDDGVATRVDVRADLEQDRLLVVV